MIRLAFVVFALSVGLIAAGNIDLQIKSTATKIKKFDEKYSSLHSKMAQTAKAILEQKGAILQQQKHLQALMLELSVKEEDYKLNKTELERLQNSQSTLYTEQKKLENELVFALARNVSLSMLLDDERVINADAMITEEVLKALIEDSKNEIKMLNQQFSNNYQRITQLEGRVASLKQAIQEIEEKQSEVRQTQEANKKALAELEDKKSHYKSSVNKLLSQQNALQQTLEELNIIKKDQIQKEKERQARLKAEEEERKRRAAAEAARKQNGTVIASAALPDVKKVGSSYANIKTKKYRGKKTIAPLDTYDVIKKFGPYTDPIYNLKIFNESISLRPKSANAKVKNVLNGKVILAQHTALLDNVVIIEHSQGIHTIYAHMDTIAPTIKKGQKVKRGSIIGRVSDELMFEVTQKNYHINPLELIH